MKIEAINIFSSAPPEVKIAHKNNEIYFSVNNYGRTAFTNSAIPDFDVFDEINKYWEQLPEEEQDIVFSYYDKIGEIFRSHYNVEFIGNSYSYPDRNTLSRSLNEVCVQLLNFHNFDKIYHWVIFRSNINIPLVFDKEYIDSPDKQGSREQTYIRSDYVKLITMSIILRTMVPVWGEFINVIRDEVGNNYKEYFAFSLIDGADILETEAFFKLIEYINLNIRLEKVNNNRIIGGNSGGISSEDFPDWLLYLICVKKLPIGNIKGNDDRAHLVSFIFQFINQKLKQTDTAPENKVKSKDSESTKENDPSSKQSKLEGYRLKQSISQGEIVELDFSINDLPRCAYRLSSSMTEELLQDSYDSTRVLLNSKIIKPQVILVQWIMKPIISPRGILFLDKNKIVDLIAVVQAVLWSKDHRYLSLLVSSRAIVSSHELHIALPDSRSKLPKDILDELDRLYPFKKIIGGKKTGNKAVNLAVKAIDNLVEILKLVNWSITAKDKYLEETFGSKSNRRLIIPHDIRLIVARLVVDIGARR